MKDPYQDKTTKIYDTGAKKYKKSTQDFTFPAWMFEYFLQLLSGKKILDLWCAYWRDISRMRKQWFDAHGLELSQELIHLADKDIKPYIIYGDITEIEKYFSPQSIDGIFCSASIVHMDKNIALNVLKASAKVLKDTWILFLQVKVSQSDTKSFTLSQSIPWVRKKYSYYRENEIIKILEDIGFQICRKTINTHESNTWMVIIARK